MGFNLSLIIGHLRQIITKHFRPSPSLSHEPNPADLPAPPPPLAYPSPSSSPSPSQELNLSQPSPSSASPHGAIPPLKLAAPQAGPPGTFHLFPSFPGEIRDQIWYLAAQNSRHYTVGEADMEWSASMKRKYGMGAYSSRVGDWRPLMGVCREARRVAARCYADLGLRAWRKF